MSRQSAGLLLYRERAGDVEVLLAHPGGPFWARRDDGAWSIVKGEIEAAEAPIDVARREFLEELGTPAPGGEWTSLGAVKQAGGKVVHAWAARGEIDPSTIRSATFELEWPPRSGRRASFPEVDRAAWFALDEARRKILASQTVLIDRLVQAIARNHHVE